MGTIELFLCILVGRFIAVLSVINDQDATFTQDFPGFFDMPFPFKRHFDSTPYDTIFSSWRSRTPDFHMLAELPPVMDVPRVQVFCDESKLTLLVDKRSSAVTVTGEEVQLGDGCYSNSELPNQFVFTYSLDACGTTRVMQNGFEMFTNSLHLNLKKPLPTWWQTPLTVHISCIPKRSYAKSNFFMSSTPPENVKTFNIKAMNPSWTGTAESNVYKRGEAVNLQVSARTRPEQQLFIQSCSVSASPDPNARPKHAVIMNKGCAAPLGSSYAIVRFVASNRADVVNFVLNTSYFISELYIHCSVVLSDQGVTLGSKSCNYNVFQSRWEDLSRTAEVCECCSLKCKGLSVKHLSEGAKAVVSTGPLVIKDKDFKSGPEPLVSEPNEPSSAPLRNSMQSDGAEDTIVSGTSISRSKLSSPLQGVLVVSQDPAARLTLWLPGQVQDAEHGENISSGSEENLTVKLQANDMVSKDLPGLQLSTTDQESLLKTPINKFRDQDLNMLTLVEGWIIPSHLEKAAIVEESKRKRWSGEIGLSGTEVPQEVDIPLPDEMTVNVLNLNDLDKIGDELTPWQTDAALMTRDGTNDDRPVLRSKLQFSKGIDGSQTLSYEEEVVKQQEREGVIRRFQIDGIKRKQEPRHKGMRSVFLDLLRRMDRAE